MATRQIGQTMIPLTCSNPECGKAFERAKTHYRPGRGKVFCSKDCKKSVRPAFSSNWKPRMTEKDIWRLVDMTPGFGPYGNCWKWVGAVGTNGYGEISLAEYKERKGSDTKARAHRLIYELVNKLELPDNQILRHKVCDTPLCVNPYHMLPGTMKDNSEDAIEKGRNAWGEKLPQHKLIEEEVIQIRSLLKKGVQSQKEIAAIFGVQQSVISRIRSGKAWKQLKEQ
jgi:predicted XRE-type DNA-binding protein